jgi:hypothetical protein
MPDSPNPLDDLRDVLTRHVVPPGPAPTPWWNWVPLVIIGVLFTGLLGVYSRDLPGRLRVQSMGVRTSGHVTHVSASTTRTQSFSVTSCSYTYVFTATDGQEYQGESPQSSRAACRLKAGDWSTISYDMHQPSRNSPADDATLWPTIWCVASVGILFIMCTVLGLVAMITTRFRPPARP